jgi:hypothetical protein
MDVATVFQRMDPALDETAAHPLKGWTCDALHSHWASGRSVKGQSPLQRVTSSFSLINSIQFVHQ